MTQALLVKE